MWDALALAHAHALALACSCLRLLALLLFRSIDGDDHGERFSRTPTLATDVPRGDKVPLPFLCMV